MVESSHNGRWGWIYFQHMNQPQGVKIEPFVFERVKTLGVRIKNVWDVNVRNTYLTIIAV